MKAETDTLVTFTLRGADWSVLRSQSGHIRYFPLFFHSVSHSLDIHQGVTRPKVKIREIRKNKHTAITSTEFKIASAERVSFNFNICKREAKARNNLYYVTENTSLLYKISRASIFSITFTKKIETLTCNLDSHSGKKYLNVIQTNVFCTRVRTFLH